ncbi:hypothetical protein BLNAU_19900 [Blattamonas nauphoetae]|uniref:HECT-type E3 ubiquitin transferase n=1 Tax=Blattamonas nauphoetae TaxID=2049346 RepID=A0ABQ9X3C7_9EUKA|nr:hypothetical protein BLNAU_19900 [Blattamonas nauphoetae]
MKRALTQHIQLVTNQIRASQESDQSSAQRAAVEAITLMTEIIRDIPIECMNSVYIDCILDLVCEYWTVNLPSIRFSLRELLVTAFSVMRDESVGKTIKNIERRLNTSNDRLKGLLVPEILRLSQNLSGNSRSFSDALFFSQLHQILSQPGDIRFDVVTSVATEVDKTPMHVGLSPSGESFIPGLLNAMIRCFPTEDDATRRGLTGLGEHLFWKQPMDLMEKTMETVMSNLGCVIKRLTDDPKGDEEKVKDLRTVGDFLDLLSGVLMIVVKKERNEPAHPNLANFVTTIFPKLLEQLEKTVHILLVFSVKHISSVNTAFISDLISFLDGLICFSSDVYPSGLFLETTASIVSEAENPKMTRIPTFSSCFQLLLSSAFLSHSKATIPASAVRALSEILKWNETILKSAVIHGQRLFTDFVGISSELDEIHGSKMEFGLTVGIGDEMRGLGGFSDVAVEPSSLLVLLVVSGDESQDPLLRSSVCLFTSRMLMNCIAWERLKTLVQNKTTSEASFDSSRDVQKEETENKPNQTPSMIRISADLVVGGIISVLTSEPTPTPAPSPSLLLSSSSSHERLSFLSPLVSVCGLKERELTSIPQHAQTVLSCAGRVVSCCLELLGRADGWEIVGGMNRMRKAIAAIEAEGEWRWEDTVAVSSLFDLSLWIVTAVLPLLASHLLHPSPLVAAAALHSTSTLFASLQDNLSSTAVLELISSICEEFEHDSPASQDRLTIDARISENDERREEGSLGFGFNRSGIIVKLLEVFVEMAAQSLQSKQHILFSTGHSLFTAVLRLLTTNEALTEKSIDNEKSMRNTTQSVQMWNNTFLPSVILHLASFTRLPLRRDVLPRLLTFLPSFFDHTIELPFHSFLVATSPSLLLSLLPSSLQLLSDLSWEQIFVQSDDPQMDGLFFSITLLFTIFRNLIHNEFTACGHTIHFALNAMTELLNTILQHPLFPTLNTKMNPPLVKTTQSAQSTRHIPTKRDTNQTQSPTTKEKGDNDESESVYSPEDQLAFFGRVLSGVLNQLLLFGIDLLSLLTLHTINTTAPNIIKTGRPNRSFVYPRRQILNEVEDEQHELEREKGSFVPPAGSPPQISIVSDFQNPESPVFVDVTPPAPFPFTVPESEPEEKEGEREESDKNTEHSTTSSQSQSLFSGSKVGIEFKSLSSTQPTRFQADIPDMDTLLSIIERCGEAVATGSAPTPTGVLCTSEVMEGIVRAGRTGLEEMWRELDENGLNDVWTKRRVQTKKTTRTQQASLSSTISSIGAKIGSSNTPQTEMVEDSIGKAIEERAARFKSTVISLYETENKRLQEKTKNVKDDKTQHKEQPAEDKKGDKKEEKKVGFGQKLLGWAGFGKETRQPTEKKVATPKSKDPQEKPDKSQKAKSTNTKQGSEEQTDNPIHTPPLAAFQPALASLRIFSFDVTPPIDPDQTVRTMFPLNTPPFFSSSSRFLSLLALQLFDTAGSIKKSQTAKDKPHSSYETLFEPVVNMLSSLLAFSPLTNITSVGSDLDGGLFEEGEEFAEVEPKLPLLHIPLSLFFELVSMSLSLIPFSTRATFTLLSSLLPLFVSPSFSSTPAFAISLKLVIETLLSRVASSLLLVSVPLSYARFSSADRSDGEKSETEDLMPLSAMHHSSSEQKCEVLRFVLRWLEEINRVGEKWLDQHNPNTETEIEPTPSNKNDEAIAPETPKLDAGISVPFSVPPPSTTPNPFLPPVILNTALSTVSPLLSALSHVFHAHTTSSPLSAEFAAIGTRLVEEGERLLMLVENAAQEENEREKVKREKEEQDRSRQESVEHEASEAGTPKSDAIESNEEHTQDSQQTIKVEEETHINKDQAVDTPNEMVKRLPSKTQHFSLCHLPPNLTLSTQSELVSFLSSPPSEFTGLPPFSSLVITSLSSPFVSSSALVFLFAYFGRSVNHQNWQIPQNSPKQNDSQKPATIEQLTGSIKLILSHPSLHPHTSLHKQETAFLLLVLQHSPLSSEHPAHSHSLTRTGSSHTTPSLHHSLGLLPQSSPIHFPPPHLSSPCLLSLHPFIPTIDTQALTAPSAPVRPTGLISALLQWVTGNEVDRVAREREERRSECIKEMLKYSSSSCCVWETDDVPSGGNPISPLNLAGLTSHDRILVGFVLEGVISSFGLEGRSI